MSPNSGFASSLGLTLTSMISPHLLHFTLTIKELDEICEGELENSFLSQLNIFILL